MRIQSVNPATEELIREFELQSFEDAKAAVMTCRDQQKKWAFLPLQSRTTFIKKLASVLRNNAEKYAKLATLEMGKPLTQARAEVEKCAVVCEYYAEHAPQFLAEQVVQTEAKKASIRFDPLGVVLAIMPWNFPFWQVFRCAVPSIAAGNAVVLKHASNVPQCALAIEEIFRAAGFPEGIFKTLLIDGPTAGKLLEDDDTGPLIDAVSLTGSTEAGSRIAEKAGTHLKKCVLELGGSDPFIIFADADLDAAAQGALTSRTVNAGQSCIAAKRFIIERLVFEKFENKMVELFRTLKMGDPLDEQVTIGPLAKKDIRDALVLQIEDAVSKGAHVLAGGKATTLNGKGYFLEPTLLTNINKDMAVYREETFGPVMVLIQAEDEDDAVQIANDTEFGLGASLWTVDSAHAEKIAAKINAGFVSINCIVKSDPRLPFGGVKKSGFGRELGAYGIKEFVNIKTVVVN